MGAVSGHTVDGFIKSVLIDELRKMVYDAGLSYLAAGNIAVGVEFLGACVDSHGFAVQGQSKARFELGINQFMAKVNARYRAYNIKTSPYFLYKQIRCGMAHLVRPQGKVALTGRGDAAKDGLRHLEVYAPEDKLILVVEDCCDDFIAACEDLRATLPTLTHPKLKGTFLPVWDVQAKTSAIPATAAP